MSKESYTRETQRSNFLKRVIIRIDYTGVVTASTFVESIKGAFIRNYFDSFYKRFIGQAKLNFSDLGSIAKTLMIPVQDLKNEPLYVFSVSPFRGTKDSVTMEISAYYTALDINCYEYQSIDPYRALISEFVHLISEQEIALSINRLGIRKANGRVFDSVESLLDTYEYGVFYGMSPDERMDLINKEYLDCFFNDEHDIKVNYKRAIVSVLDSERKPKLQTGLDIDVYVDNDIIRTKHIDLCKDFVSVFDRLNDYQFYLYRNSVTERYLASTSNE